MSRVSTISRACALVAALVAGAGHAVAASAPPTSAPAGSAPADGDFVLPDGWTTLVDDTNTITVAVPNTWVDVDTSSLTNDDGTVMPSIVAATNIQTFIDEFTEPGVLYRAIPYDADQQALMDAYGLTGGCRRKNVEPYDDGAFVGLHGIWTSCGSTFDPEWHQIVASPASQSFTVVLQIQITGPDEASVIDDVLASFNFTPQGGSTPGPFPPTTNPGATTTTAPAETSTTTTTVAAPTTATATTVTLPPVGISTTAPVTTAAPVTTTAPLPQPSGSTPADWQQFVDNQGVLSIHVPPSWTDVNTRTFTGQGLTDAPYISATPDSDLFFPDEGETDTWSVPGVYYVGLPFSLDLESEMNTKGELPGCTPQGAQPYTDGVFTGLIQEQTSCGGTATRVIAIVANPADNSRTVLLVLQLTGSADDAAIYDGVLSSFNLIGPAATGGATTTSP
jgi:hypothetical protein